MFAQMKGENMDGVYYDAVGNLIGIEIKEDKSMTEQEAKNMAENLRNSAEAIILGKQFANSQPNILALDAFGAYSKTRDIEDVYKLDLIQEIIKML